MYWGNTLKILLLSDTTVFGSVVYFDSKPTIQVEQHVCLEQVFGSVYLAICHIRTQRHPAGNPLTVNTFKTRICILSSMKNDTVYTDLPFELSEANHLTDGPWFTHHVKSPQACISVTGVKGLKAVTQVPLTRHLCQLTGQILRINQIQLI